MTLKRCLVSVILLWQFESLRDNQCCCFFVLLLTGVEEIHTLRLFVGANCGYIGGISGYIKETCAVWSLLFVFILLAGNFWDIFGTAPALGEGLSFQAISANFYVRILENILLYFIVNLLMIILISLMNPSSLVFPFLPKGDERANRRCPIEEKSLSWKCEPV